ncbi:Protein phosphatase 1 regulatory subunit 15A [Bagarius yarrelli]|uniref:Protein DP71L n=1 Tax=Bagarius yarrelli TaxID=175774 RepID=A0A556TVA2_BAGYA|nr:Protein phosphatase 1 regulatory subunit 15A [Bagarius yarrelli]
MVVMCDTPQRKSRSQSDQLIMAKTLLADWRGGQFEKQDEGSDCETEWSEEEDNDVSEMSLENRAIWKSFLNARDHNNPFHLSIKVKTSENDHRETEGKKGVESVPLSIQGKHLPECSEEEDSDWSEEEVSEMSSENRDLWEFFLNNSDPYNLLHVSCSTKVKTSDYDHTDDEEEEEEPFFLGSQKKGSTEISKEEETDWSIERLLDIKDLKNAAHNQLHVSCPTEVKLKVSEIQQTPAPLRHTACEVGQSTKKPAKKVRFSKQLTIHTLQTWSAESRAARDGSCWMEMARDRHRFKRRVNQAEEIISTCLTAQHRAKVIASLLNRSERSSLVTDCQKKLLSFIMAAIFLKIFVCTAVVFSSIR